jgi:ribosome-binding protein aMBF1 (putative translation factor)
MPTHQLLPSIRDSEIVICRRCKTRQYPRNGSCVRCNCALGLDYLNLQVGNRFDPRTVHDERQLARSLGILLRSLRKRRGFSQSQLAMRAAGCIARAQLSKAECGHVLLPLSKLLPIAKALGLTAVILRFETTTSLAGRQSKHRR